MYLRVSDNYPRLFEPLRIGPCESRNRIVFGAHFTMFTEPAPRAGEPGFFGERLGRYLEARAAGGAGIVIAGQAAALLVIWYAVVGCTCACPAMITPAPPRARSSR